MEKTKEIASCLKKLNTAHSKYQGAIGSMEALLVGSIGFEFTIMYQPSDGFVVVDEDGGNNAALRDCIREINKNGTLSYDDYLEITI